MWKFSVLILHLRLKEKQWLKLFSIPTMSYWKELSTNPEKYSLEKQKVADLLAEKLEKRFPRFKNKIEAVDVVTPISVEHWTGSYQVTKRGVPQKSTMQIVRQKWSQQNTSWSAEFLHGGTVGWRHNWTKHGMPDGSQSCQRALQKR